MTALKAFLLWLGTTLGGFVPCDADLADGSSSFTLTSDCSGDEGGALPTANRARSEDDGGIYNGF